eukprot:gene18645-22258_t
MGNTSINGHMGNTSINGHLGNTSINGHLGNTSINGHPGKTSINGHLGKTSINGHPGNTSINGHPGNTSINGHPGKTSINGHQGKTSINGHQDNTSINGHLGNTSINGHPGNTSINGHLKDLYQRPAEDSCRAAKLLPENLQPHPEHVQVSYRLFNEYEIKPMGMGLDLASGRKVKDVNELNDMKQPLVIREPHSGKRSLVGTYHVSRIEAHGSKALTFEESNNYIAQAWAPGLQDDLLYRHKWQAGDMVAWSNRL